LADLSGNAKIIYDTLVNSGATPQGAHGILAGLMGESRTLDPEAVQRDTGAYGIGQWLGARQGRLTDYAAENELEPDDINTQSNFLVHELQNDPSYAKTWAAATNPNATAQNVLATHVANYERPSKTEGGIQAEVTRRTPFLEQQPSEITPAAFHPIAGKLSDIPGAAEIGRSAGAPARPAGFGFGNISGQVSNVPRAEAGPMNAPPLPPGAAIPPPQPPPLPYALPPGTATAPPGAAPAPPLPTVRSSTGPQGSGDVVARPDPTAGTWQADPNMPEVYPGRPLDRGPMAVPASPAPRVPPSEGGQPPGTLNVMNVPPPPSQQAMLASALAQGQGQPAPAVDQNLLALALQGGGAPDFGSADGGLFG
jgi:hypothetical protein